MRLKKSLVGSTPNEIPVREGTREVTGWKRVVHGGVAWTAAAKADDLHQPQDGAQENGTLYTAMTRMAFREPEDARLTGSTRSLMRRVMGLNVTAPMLSGARNSPARPVATTSQAQVA
jgi:hypothetical protein